MQSSSPIIEAKRLFPYADEQDLEDIAQHVPKVLPLVVYFANTISLVATSDLQAIDEERSKLQSARSSWTPESAVLFNKIARVAVARLLREPKLLLSIQEAANLAKRPNLLQEAAEAATFSYMVKKGMVFDRFSRGL